MAALRAATPFTTDRIHLNHAGHSPSSSAVLETVLGHLRREAEIGGYEAADKRADDDAAVYASIARLLGCRPDEIARQEHATAAWNSAYWSVPMVPGQRILTAEAAYGANAVAHLHAERVRGVIVEVIPSDDAVGAGSLPTVVLPGFAVGLRSADVEAGQLASRLRAAPRPVFTTVKDHRVHLHVRTVHPDEESHIADALVHALSASS